MGSVRTQSEQRRKPVIGLTGGIGAGKSMIAGIFASLGAVVIDSDRLIHEQYDDPSVVEKLRQWWGNSVVSDEGSIDRKVVASIVFDNKADLSRLESLLYPKIEHIRQSLMADYHQDHTVLAIVLDSPKLYEAGLHHACDFIVFVQADKSIRQSRVVQSRGWDKDELDKREKLLDPLDKKVALADYVVVNHAGKADVVREVERILSAVLASYSSDAE